MEMHLYKPLKELRVKDLLHEFMGIVSHYRLLLPADLYLMIKTLTGKMEALVMKLDPDFDMIDKAAPYIRKIRVQKFDPRRKQPKYWNWAGIWPGSPKIYPQTFGKL